MKVLAIIMLAACGRSPEPIRVMPPNTAQACQRAVICEVFLPEQIDPCVACLEHVDPKFQALADEYLAANAIDDAPCNVLTRLYHDSNLSTCVVARWYGP